MVGAVAIFIAKAADLAQVLFQQLIAFIPWAPLLVTPLGFGVSAWLMTRFSPHARGSGIPQVIAARHFQDPRLRKDFVSVKTAISKALLLLLGLACGASTGREGPTVQMGAAVMFFFSRFTPIRQPGFLLAGAAAGIAGAFNTPLAGIVFGIEEMSRSFESRSSGLIIGAVVAGGLTSLAILGNYNYFGTINLGLPFGYSWLAVPLCGVVCGLMGGLFARVLILLPDHSRWSGKAWILRNPVVFAALCGLGVAIVGHISGNHVFGTGYDEARRILHVGPTADGMASMPADVGFSFGPLKFLASLLSSLSSIPGGIFAPSLAVGAGLGADAAWLFPDTPLAVLALLGMVSYLSGVVQAPITSFVIVSEMTQDHALIVPMMLASLIATRASKLISPQSLYHRLAELMIERIEPHTTSPVEGAGANAHASPATP
ncbi:MAG: chloride channel protein [Hyphomicrobiales bacterium]|nr:chloride channel protein [Hyphomicrobiales bacterium]MDE2116190.1 chloride channel protein [Hyphomicrobiales bacterium]